MLQSTEKIYLTKSTFKNHLMPQTNLPETKEASRKEEGSEANAITPISTGPTDTSNSDSNPSKTAKPVFENLEWRRKQTNSQDTRKQQDKEAGLQDEGTTTRNTDPVTQAIHRANVEWLATQRRKTQNGFLMPEEDLPLE